MSGVYHGQYPSSSVRRSWRTDVQTRDRYHPRYAPQVACYIYYLIRFQSCLYNGQNMRKSYNEAASSMTCDIAHDEGHTHAYAHPLWGPIIMWSQLCCHSPVRPVIVQAYICISMCLSTSGGTSVSPSELIIGNSKWFNNWGDIGFGGDQGALLSRASWISTWDEIMWHVIITQWIWCHYSYSVITKNQLWTCGVDCCSRRFPC